MKRFTTKRISHNGWNASAVVVDRKTGKLFGRFQESCAKKLAQEMNELDQEGYEHPYAVDFK